MRVQFLYFKGCPHYEPTMKLLRQVLSEFGIEAQVEIVEVKSRDDARRLHFVGSPTILVNGIDIEPEAHERGDFALTCRLYGDSGVPPQKLVRTALSRNEPGP